MKGFLGSHAAFTADLNLVVELAMGVALLAGTYLARQKRFVAHGVCQALVLLLNLPLIVLVMWPPLHDQVMPHLAAHLTRRYYAVAVLHGGLGLLAELLGLYIVLVAGTNFIPRRLCFQNWKFWMRLELTLWWIAVLAGVGVYFIWYIPPAKR